MDREVELPEEMAAFFDARADGYDEYMRDVAFGSGPLLRQFYQAVAAPIAPSSKPLQILDLGCGTGLELEQILGKAPRASIMGIDVSQRVLEQLRQESPYHVNATATGPERANLGFPGSRSCGRLRQRASLRSAPRWTRRARYR